MFEILKAEAQLLWRSPIAVEMEDALDGYNATIYTVARLCFVNKIRRESRKRNGADMRADLFFLFFFFFVSRIHPWRFVLEGRRIVASLAKERDICRGSRNDQSSGGRREVDLRRVTKFVQRSSPINHSTVETTTAGISMNQLISRTVRSLNVKHVRWSSR